MLSITYNTNGKVWSESFHIGEYLFKSGENKVLSVQADGDELSLIMNNFRGIPFCNSPVQKWRGEFAQFIVDNLGKYDGLGYKLA